MFSMHLEEGNGQVPTPRTRRRTKKKKEFVGCGSRQVIEFLESIGKQTGARIPPEAQYQANVMSKPKNLSKVGPGPEKQSNHFVLAQ